MSLVELLVYSLLLVFVVLIAGSLLIRTLQTQRDVTTVSQTNNDALLTFGQLERDARNAAKGKTSDGGNLLLLATRVASDADPNTWVCVGYYYNPGTKVLRRVSSTSTTATAAAAVAGSGSALAASTAAWPVALEQVSLLGARVFGTVDGTVTSGSTLDASLSTATSGTHKPVAFQTSINLRPQSGSVPACFA